MKPYAVVLADDHIMFRQGVRSFIEKIDGIKISAEVNDGVELLNYLKTSTPDLIILDIAMPHLRGLEALREIKKLYSNIKVLILTMYENPEFVQQSVADGAEGFVIKGEPISELIHAIKAIRDGKKYFSSRLSETLVSLIRVDGAEEKEYPLTWREREVLRYLARGTKAQDISDALYISIHTVRRHRYNIMKKLNIKSATDLIKYAISQGFAD